MLTAINPKLPMRDKAATKAFYIDKLGFSIVKNADYDEYLMLEKDAIELHFFLFKNLNPMENYGQVYIRTNDIAGFYASLLAKKIAIHPNAPLQLKPWGQKEFSLLDADNNLLTFGEAL